MNDFDPGDHTIDEVKEYVEDNPDECEAILDAEEEGKARSSLVSWLRSHLIVSGDAGEGDADSSADTSAANRGRVFEDDTPERVDPNTYPDPENPPRTP